MYLLCGSSETALINYCIVFYCIVSDCLQHDANAVNTFISKVLKHIKTVLPNLTFCYYFNDGAASQYIFY